MTALRSSPPQPTLGDWRRGASARLAAAGIDTAAREADLIAGHVLGLTTSALITSRTRVLSPGERRRLQAVLARRARRVPLQYLLREVDFYGLTLEVSPAAFIPRPETEGLVERVLARLDPDEAGPVLEVGAGTGCIALALAAARPRLGVWAVEIDPPAARLARRNARRTRLADRVRILVGDLTAPWRRIHPDPDGSLRALVSNPPYVALSERALLPPEVADHEPPTALFAAGRGLDVIRRLEREGRNLLRPGGFLALEIGERQGSAVRALLEGARRRSGRPYWNDVSIERDLAGRDRYAFAVMTERP